MAVLVVVVHTAEIMNRHHCDVATIVTARAAPSTTPEASSSVVSNDSTELRNCWHPIARSAEISTEPRKFWLLGTPLVAFRAAGELTVLLDRCPHRRAPLSEGAIVDGTIECAYHGWRFGRDGACVSIPSMRSGPYPPAARVVAPKVAECNGLVFVALDTPLVAIPEIDLAETSTRRVVELEPYVGRFSAAQLIDNQIDISHFSFVHRATFGVVDEPLTPSYEIQRNDWGFRLDAEVPIVASNDPAARAGHRPLRQHRLMSYRYVAPFFVEIALSYPSSGGSMVVTFFAQPEQPDRARMYVSLAFSQPGGLTDDELAERVAFERRVIAEDLALQASFDELDLPLAAGSECHVRADRASLEYRRILAALFGASRSGPSRAN
jgi:phenylpropionate dioxygenase-like ring-hydroxylating dioxygenase large terminal subunit